VATRLRSAERMRACSSAAGRESERVVRAGIQRGHRVVLSRVRAGDHGQERVLAAPLILRQIASRDPTRRAGRPPPAPASPPAAPRPPRSRCPPRSGCSRCRARPRCPRETRRHRRPGPRFPCARSAYTGYDPRPTQDEPSDTARASRSARPFSGPRGMPAGVERVAAVGAGGRDHHGRFSPGSSEPCGGGMETRAATCTRLRAMWSKIRKAISGSARIPGAVTRFRGWSRGPSPRSPPPPAIRPATSRNGASGIERARRRCGAGLRRPRPGGSARSRCRSAPAICRREFLIDREAQLAATA